jgi:hypothetical protein
LPLVATFVGQVPSLLYLLNLSSLLYNSMYHPFHVITKASSFLPIL